MSTAEILVSIHDFKLSRYKKYYGASKKVFIMSHVNKLISMWSDLHYLGELHTRTRLTPHNEEFLYQKAIPHYNNGVRRLRAKYPNIKEFQNYKLIDPHEYKYSCNMDGRITK